MTTEGTPEPIDVPRPRTTTPITEGETRAPAGKPFQAYMEGANGPNPLLQSGKSPQISPFDLAHGQVPAAGPTFTSIQEQSKTVQSTLGDINNQLNTKNLKLKQSTKYLLKNKLGSALGHLRSANNKLGGQDIPEERAPASAGPIRKFLGVVTNGQYLLQEAQSRLTELSKKGEQLKPADMLLIQIKLSKAQQELSYTSIMLSKAVDDLKMMMNIQL